MKRLVVLLMLVLSVAGLTATVVEAKTGVARGAGLGIGETGECVFGATVDGTLYVGEGTSNLTLSESGHITFQCNVELFLPAPESGLVGFAETPQICWDGDSFVFTLDWHVAITPSGKAKLTCRL